MVTLTVYFDDPWWVGVVEMEADGELRVARQVFGSEPPNEVVHQFVLRELPRLLAQPRLGLPSNAAPLPRRVNPKRAAREAGRLTDERGLATRAQAALRLEMEARKKERRVQSRAEREREAEVKREKARAKALAKRRGH